MDRIDIMERERSLPLLIDYLEKGIEPSVTTRTLVLIDRYLWNWKGLYNTKTQTLTLEGGTLLLRKWIGEISGRSDIEGPSGNPSGSDKKQRAKRAGKKNNRETAGGLLEKGSK